ncbi:MAG: DUF4421 domain-containing protein, partial [Prevotellaceae bacterium]|nr:DUF4421 domain-containing protein [Prevotellaceae bacterium]
MYCQETVSMFDGKFAVSISGNYNIGIFTHGQTQSFRTDEPWKMGLGLRYKKYSLSFSIPLNFQSNSLDMEFNSYSEKLYFESYLKRYKTYYADKTNEFKNAGLDIMNIGITAGWIQNSKNHSLGSVYNKKLDRKQNISSGSFLYGFGVYYTSIYSDNTEIHHYNERNSIIHFGPSAGYSYTWVLSHNMFINTGINIGANLGINT